MSTKRGLVFVIVSLLFLFTLSSVYAHFSIFAHFHLPAGVDAPSTEEMEANDYPVGSDTHGRAHNFFYIDAFGVSHQDQTDYQGCSGNNNNKAAYYGALTRADAWTGSSNSFGFTTESSYQRDDGRYCQWENLQPKSNGCYLLAQEEDEWDKSDCSGIIAPLESIIDYTPKVAKDFFESDEKYQTANFKQQLHYENNLFSGEFEKGGFDSESIETECILQEYLFDGSGPAGSGASPPPPRAYVCVNGASEEPARWYACDRDRVGQYIRISLREDENGNVVNEEDRGKAWFCKETENGLTWEKEYLNCADEGVDCDTNKDVCQNEANKFDFIETPGGNNCCGNDGMEDLGRKGTVGQDNFLCLKMDDAVRSSLSGDETGGSQASCAGKDWCWLDDSEEAFRIKTIKKVEDNQLVTYDVVSNGQGWYECDANGIQANNQLPSGGLEVDTTKANRFQFYKEGERYSWA